MKIVKYNSSSQSTSNNSSNSSNGGTTYIGGTSVTNNSSVSLDMHYIFGQPYNGTQDVDGDLSNVDNIYADGNISSSSATIDNISAQTISGVSLEYDEGQINAFTATTINSNSISGNSINADDLNATEGKITNLSASTASTDYITSIEGYIHTLLSDSITVDNLTVTKAAHFFKLVIDELKSVGGSIILTTANADICKVETLSSGDYRCYFRVSDGDKTIDNQFVNQDQIVCMTFNAAEGTTYNASNKYYWRLCLGIDDKPVTVDVDGQDVVCHYVDISSTDMDSDSNAIPEKGDKIVQLGHRSDSDRQNAIIISAYQNIDKEVKAPSIVQYKGINTYDLASHRKTTISPNNNQFTGKFIVTSDDDSETNIEDLVKGVEIQSQKDYFLTSDKSDGITNQTTGWNENATLPTEDKPYLWKFTRTTYKNGTVIDGTAYIVSTYSDKTEISISDDGYWVIDGVKTNIKATGSDGHSPYIDNTTNTWWYWDSDQGKYVDSGIVAKGSSVSISSTSITYATSNQGTDSTKVSGWQNDIPQTTDEMPWLWTQTIVIYTDGNSTTSYSVSYKGKDGESGTSVTIISTEIRYAISNQGTDSSKVSGWQESMQSATDDNPYQWTRTIVKYSDGKSTTSYNVSYNGKDGISGTSVYITATSIDYATAAQGTDSSKVDGWQKAIPSTTDDKPYLWTRTTVSYSDGNVTISYSVSYKGKDGDDGNSISAITNFYLASSLSANITTSTAGWSTEVQATTEEKRFLWNYERIDYTKSSSTYTDPHIIGVYGEKGEDGNSIVSITEHYLATSQNSNVTTATTGWDSITAITSTRRYLWNYETIVYSKTATVNTTPHIIGVYGNDGKDGLSINRNLLRNADFHTLNEIFDSSGNQLFRLNGGDSYTQISPSAYGGTDGGYVNVPSTVTESHYYGFFFTAPIEAGKTYTASVMAKGNSTNLLLFEIIPSTGGTGSTGRLSGRYGTQVTSITSNWTQYKTTFTIPSTATSTTFVEVNFWVSGSGTLYICQPKLEEGENVTAFCLNEADLKGESGETPTYYETEFTRKTLEVVFKNASTTYTNGCLKCDFRGTVNLVKGDDSTPTANKTINFTFYNESGGIVTSASTTSNSSGEFTYTNSTLQNPYHTATNKITYCKVDIP